ncbi:MAG TPA: DegT/DnrJ/EryC1/StrS family aminotransferase [Dehalococcoidia bacterium]|nr:DegT/DnrJ/EryC1/StrS family aminotransferase [Dehalococcoidia bacterium]
MIRIAQPQIGAAEKRAVLEVLDSGWLANGPVLERFEEEFASHVSRTRYAVAVANGTAALHLALLAHGIGPDDEVIVPAFSFQASASMVLAVGAKPVFVDVGEDGNLEPSQAEAVIGPKTKALLPVHLYGRLCDMERLTAIAQRHGLAVIEDAAQAHGAEAEGRRAGSFGTGCFSLYATKNLTAGEGGVVTTDDPVLAERIRRLRNHGEARRYESVELGFNYRLPEVGAALALSQLARLEEWTRKRRENAAYLSSRLVGVMPPKAPRAASEHVWNQYTVRVPQGRDALREHLWAAGIEAAVYYPKPLPAQPLFQPFVPEGEVFPVATQLANEVLSLPVHPGLSQADLDRIVESVNAWARAREAQGAGTS